MGRHKKYVTPEEKEARRESRRAATRERMRRLRSDPEYRAGEAAARRQRIAGDPEFRARVTEQKRASSQTRRQNDPGLRVMENFQRQVRKSMRRADQRFARKLLNRSRLLEPSPAADHASSITWASHLAGRGNSLTQCKVPVESKCSQADFKPRSRNVGVQAQHGRKVLAGLVRRNRAAAGMHAVHRSKPEAAELTLRLWEELKSTGLVTAP
ncbi:uncharacterized protein LOC144145883 [Haemaphysalis longicornis]